MGLQSFTDQLGREITIPFPPKRIVSIVPSQTEFLFDLGLQKEIVGLSKFCIHPAGKAKFKVRVGGTKKLNISGIKSLHPHLIIANKEENEEDQVRELMKFFPVWISDIKTLEDAYDMMERVGAMTAKRRESLEITIKIQHRIKQFYEYRLLKDRFRTLRGAYLIWHNPLMTIGKDTFIHHLLELAGFQNIFSDHIRYPSITIEDLKQKNPEIILLSSEPFPFGQKHIDELQKHLPGVKIILVDGEMFSWYGSRLIKAADYFRQLHQSLFVPLHSI